MEFLFILVDSKDITYLSYSSDKLIVCVLRNWIQSVVDADRFAFDTSSSVLVLYMVCFWNIFNVHPGKVQSTSVISCKRKTNSYQK